MSITGNLKTMELAELLQWLSQGQKTGTLVFDNSAVEKKIFFRDGMIISSSSSNPAEHLGSVLVSHGYLDEQQLTAAVQEQERNKVLLGKILVNQGFITEEQLHSILQMKAEESIFDVFSWSEGDFRFRDGELPDYPMVPISLDVTGLILEGTHRTDEWLRIRELIPNSQCVPVAVVDLLAAPDLDEVSRLILEMVDDDRSIDEIMLQSHMNEYWVSRTVFQHACEGRVKVVRPRGVAEKATRSGGAVDATRLQEAAEHFLASADWEQAIRHLRAARALDPSSKKLQKSIKDAEERIAATIESDGIVPNAVPHLERTMEQLTQLDLNPQEGFVLTRINGSYDVQSILKISPMPPLDALLVFWKLKNAGHIRLVSR